MTNMRTALLLILLSLTASMSTVYAEEGSPDDVNAYCTEQAQLAGIEDADELRQYIQDCIDSYTAPAGE